MSRLDWSAILHHAAAVVRSYDTSVTLRQLFYRLVAIEVLANTTSAYKTLSSRTAEARRDGTFPDLVDRTRIVHRFRTFTSAPGSYEWLKDIYRRDRTEGQEVSVYLGVEKAGIVNQLQSWFGDLGVPILALGGYSSQSFVDEVRSDVYAQRRPAVLLYAGDFDPSGEDIDRDFVARTDCWDKVVRVALSVSQVIEHSLPPQMGKAADSRAKAFTERHGALLQVELDALPVNVLRELYSDALQEFWDESAYEESLVWEAEDQAELVRRWS